MPILLSVETATRPTLSEPAFHADDGEQVAGYRTLSALAIVSLIFGLASILCLASRLFLVLPLVGIAISLVALRRITAHDGVLGGRGAAITGLVLCVVFGVATISRDAVTRHLRTAQAEEFGREWLNLLIRGEVQPAFRMTVESTRPAPTPEPGVPAPSTPASPYDEFLKHSFVKALSAAGPDAHVEFLRDVEILPQLRDQFAVRQQFRVTAGGAGADEQSGRQPVDVILALQRSRVHGQPQSRWMVAAFEMTSGGDVQAESEHADHSHADHHHVGDHAGHDHTGHDHSQHTEEQ
jgi:hypothetical protein